MFRQITGKAFRRAQPFKERSYSQGYGSMLARRPDWAQRAEPYPLRRNRLEGIPARFLLFYSFADKFCLR